MRICYFGIYDPQFSRNRIYLKGLRESGVEVIEVRDAALGWRKWLNLARALSAASSFDAVVVGYPGHIMVPLARLFSRGTPVVADLLGSLWDAARNSHVPEHMQSMQGQGWRTWQTWRWHWILFKAKAADELAIRYADTVLLESEAQREYFEQVFGPSKKYRVLYTGAWLPVQPRRTSGAARGMKDFMVIFRGSLTPECGIMHILDAAKRLAGQGNITFKIVGRGKLLPVVESRLRGEKLSNVELVSKRLSDDEFARVYDATSLALGQFEDNPRLSRTIPHKAFEAFAAGVPYLSGDGAAVREVVVDSDTGFIVPLADPEALADKILLLSKEPETLDRVAHRAQSVFAELFSPKALGQHLVSLIQQR